MRQSALAFVFIALCPSVLLAQEAKGVEFFEKKIRPVLVEHCYRCHSVESGKHKGELYLDSRDGLLKGGESGPAIVAGQPGKSLLVEALHYKGEVRMPPRGKLPARVIADFEAWVNMGAPDPRQPLAKAPAPEARQNAGKDYWAYQPVRKPKVPEVEQAAWALNEVDRFLLAAMEAKGVKPAADAPPHVLIRRVYFDLIGLPPTPEQIDTFAAAWNRDPSQRDAVWAQVVDELLASPRFGERWGRHWLDVARYAESLTLRGFVLKEAWRYRDYVIDCFNQDVPFNRFITEQIAGDLLPADTVADRRKQMIATAFLAMGNTNLEEQNKKQLRMDVIDEQIETLGKAFLGQTIACARCHDHKFDPIPTRDYYAIAGILRSTKTIDASSSVGKWLEVPLPMMPRETQEVEAHEKVLANLKQDIEALKKSIAQSPPPAETKTKNVKARVVPLASLPGVVVDDAAAEKVGSWSRSTFSGSYIGDGYVHDGNAGQGEKTLTFHGKLPASGKYEVRLAYSWSATRATKVQVKVFSEDGENTLTVNQRQRPLIEDLFHSLGQYNFEKTGQCYVMISNAGADGHVTADAVQFIAVEKLADANKSAAPPVSADQVAKDSARLKQLEEQLKNLTEKGPAREMVLTVLEDKQIENARIHIRGSPTNLGEEVPRGFLQVVSVGAISTLPAQESGRRQLAEWIASDDNPLTARVTVNRLWTWLFGEGLVRSVDNFGTTGESPSHPGLLDYLASRFKEEGWSVKKTLRLLATSRAYRQVSLPASPADPENRLLSHMSRRRLDAECIRDAMVSVAGELSLTGGGLAIKMPNSDYNYKHTATRRSVYSPVFRNSLPELFEVFDFADPSVPVGKRNVSTVAPQALFMMNNPLVLSMAQATAKRLLADKSVDERTRLTQLYRLALGREPSETEQRLALAYLAEIGADRPEAWARLAHAIFASIDFRYVH